MIRFENTEVSGWEADIRGMRNTMDSWEKSDSGYCRGGDGGIGCKNCYANGRTCDCHHEYDDTYQIGRNDHDLMMRLTAGGPVHAKFRRMVIVYVDILAPLYWSTTPPEQALLVQMRLAGKECSTPASIPVSLVD